jgi:protoporphyrinogen oxidase
MSGGAKVLVLGGGMCGLYAARVLAERGVPVTVFEKGTAPGGLAASQEFNGNYYDLGVHHLHAFDHEIFEDMKVMIGERLHPADLTALICFGNGCRRYPLEFRDLLKSIPFLTLAKSIEGLMLQMVRNKFARAPAWNAEEALIRLYGRPLYEHFFRGFTHEYWGVPPSGLSATFVRTRMPRLSAVDVVKRALESVGIRGEDVAEDSALAHETVWYTPTGSREMPIALAEHIRKHGGEIFLESTVSGIETENGRVTAVQVERNGETRRISCTDCISTMPIPELIRSMTPAPPADVLEACDHLRYKPIAVYGLLVRKPKVFDVLFIYFRHRIFHRIAEPKHSGLAVHPPGHSVLVVEMTCDEGDDRWNGGEATRQRILDDLEAEGLVHRDEVAEFHLLHSAYGYPIFKLDFEPYYEKTKGYLAGFRNLSSVGRQGSFCYPTMHVAMRMGSDAAKKVIERRCQHIVTMGSASTNARVS